MCRIFTEDDGSAHGQDKYFNVFHSISIHYGLFIAHKKNTLVEEQLAAHAHLVQFLLRTARRVARVAIVKSSVSLVHPIPWRIHGTIVYLPTSRYHKISTIHVGRYTIVPWMAMEPWMAMGLEHMFTVWQRAERSPTLWVLGCKRRLSATQRGA